MAKRPKDLVTLDVASILFEKSKSSLRYYLKNGKVTKYKLHPDKKNSPVMVSKEELKTYLAVNGLPKSKSSKGRPKSKVLSREVIKQERDTALNEIIMLKAQIKMKDDLIKMAQQHTDDIKSANLTLDNQLKSLRTDLSYQVERNEKLENKVNQLTYYLSLPWYKRFGKSLPLLNG
jgi:hypothetical protein